MANPDDYWRFLAQAILQQSQAGSAQAMQVAQMNMALEDQRMKAQQYQQDLELRRQQLEQSKAESQARIAEAQSAQDVNKLRLKEATSDYNQKEADRFVADVSMTPEDRVNLARAPLDKLAADKAEAESRNRMYAAQAGKAEFDLQNAPDVLQSEQNLRAAQTDREKLDMQLRQAADARAAQESEATLQKHNLGIAETLIQQHERSNDPEGLTKEERAKLAADIDARVVPQMVEQVGRLQAMSATGSVKPEVLSAALEQMHQAASLATSAHAVMAKDASVGKGLRADLYDIALDKTIPQDQKQAKMQALIAKANEEAKAAEASRPVAPESKPASRPSSKLSLMTTEGGPITKAKQANVAASKSQDMQEASKTLETIADKYPQYIATLQSKYAEEKGSDPSDEELAAWLKTKVKPLPKAGYAGDRGDVYYDLDQVLSYAQSLQAKAKIGLK